MNARLKVLHEKSNVKQVKLQATTLVGRSSECDLKIASSLVSRRHCKITVLDDAVYIEDLGSANGTFVDGEPLEPNQPKAVSPGAKVSIGPAEFLVDYVAPTSNTVVIRRANSTGKPDATEAQIASAAGDSALFLSTINAKQEDLKPKKNVPVAAPVPPVIPTAPPVAKAVDVVATATVVPPVASPVAKQADVVVVQPPAEADSPQSELPFQFGQFSPLKANEVLPQKGVRPLATEDKSETINREGVRPRFEAKPANAPKTHLDTPSKNAGSNTASPAPAAPVPPVEFAEFVEPRPVVETVENDVSEFNFADPTQPGPAKKSLAKSGKGAVVKSLFSMFGPKPKSSKSPPPLEDHVEGLKETRSEPVGSPDETSGFELGGAVPSESEVNSVAPEEETKDAPDDDFQNFLRQF